jgi:hypothetical protein
MGAIEDAAVVGALQDLEGAALTAKLAELVQDRTHAASANADPFADRWKTLGEWGSDWLSTPPPERRWLLERVLPLGKVGMLVAAGGVGKTMALVQLALSVATGREWLDHFGTPNPGHVLLALGEEDEGEIRRRMYNAACAMCLTDEQKRVAADRIVALPLAGTSVALTESDGRSTTESATLHALRKRLDGAAHDWRLIILDPLSRFAGCDTEKDNNAATRFIEVVESLAMSKGGPTVLLAHHTNKASRLQESESTTANARGASALTDGVRWVANLDREGDGLAKIAVTKNNYELCGPSLTLVRMDGGVLRAEKPAELEQRVKAESAKTDNKPRNGKALDTKAKAEDFDA